ncbi:MAG: AraC family transcriptional regulator [Tepidisphaeraceae bacterium]
MRKFTKNHATTSAVYLERVNLAIDFILNHLAEPVRLADVSRAAMFSPYHFHRIFQMLVGVTIADFVKRLRLEKSLVIMSHSRGLSLTQIALACGFSSSSDFSRSFRQRYGIAPRKFDLSAWRESHGARLHATAHDTAPGLHVQNLPARHNPDGFKVKIRDLPARTVAYIRVPNPYTPNAVPDAAKRLVTWAQRHGLLDAQWLGYQWDNPELVSLEDCQYHVAVEAERFTPAGEVGRFRFPRMTVAQVEVRGEIDLELRALQWLFGTWLPRSRYVPDDQPCFEAWIGRPFAHGVDRFELHAQLPVRKV